MRTGRALTTELIIDSGWNERSRMAPCAVSASKQYVEMPFYNQPFFDQLTQFEFLLHAMPAGRVQLQGLEGVWTRQEHLMPARNNDTPQSVVDRLWQAHDINEFNRAWSSVWRISWSCWARTKRRRTCVTGTRGLNRVVVEDNRATFDKMLSGRLLKWLDPRQPDVPVG